MIIAVLRMFFSIIDSPNATDRATGIIKAMILTVMNVENLILVNPAA